MTQHPFLAAATKAARAIDPHKTKSNPRVGCVLVRAGKIIATGAHTAYGQPHAEVEAITKAQANGINISDCTLYLTLEPCSPYPGKKTPACTELLLKLKPHRVVVGALDPHFSGQGLAAIEAAGIETHLAKTNHHQTLNPWFNTWIKQNRPFMTLKVAQSLDGKITPAPADYALGNRRITSARTQSFVHQMRATYQAILTTTATVLQDNPHFDVRHTNALPHPVSNPDLIVLGTRPLPPHLNIFKAKDRLIHFVPNLDELMAYCRTQQIASVMTECGGTINSALLAADLIDQIKFFVAPTYLGDASKPNFKQNHSLKNFKLSQTQSFDPDIYLNYQRSA